MMTCLFFNQFFFQVKKKTFKKFKLNTKKFSFKLNDGRIFMFCKIRRLLQNISFKLKEKKL